MTDKTVASRSDDMELWTRFLAARDAELRDAVILRYVPLVHYVLSRLGISPTIGPEYEDLAGQGLLGLIDAVDRYDPNYGTQFSTYATLRIRGHILDQLRALDWLSRAARRRARDLQEAVTILWGQLQRSPTDEELAAHLRVDVEQLRHTLADADRVLISLDTVSDDGDGGSSLHEALADDVHEDNADPSETLLESDLRQRLASAIKALPEREQLVLSLYYHEELTMKEIGAVLDLSESRVCQLHARAVMNLRATLSDERPVTSDAALPEEPDTRHAPRAPRENVYV